MNTDDPRAGFNESSSQRLTSRASRSPELHPASAPELKSLLGLAVAAIVVASLYFAQEVLIQLTLAVMLSFVLAPMVDMLRRLGLWRGPAVIASMLLALGVIGLVGVILAGQAAALSTDAPAYAATIQRKVDGVRGFATERLDRLTRQLGASRSAAVPPPPPAVVGGTAAPTPKSAREPLLVELAEPEPSAVVVTRRVLEPVIAPLETTVIVLVIAIFILLQKEDLRDRFIRIFGAGDLHRTTLAIDDAGSRLTRYFLSQLAVNASFGVVITLGLWALGIPSPALWGVIGGLLRFVPYVGSLIAAVGPLALGAAIDPGWTLALSVALLFIVVEPLTGYVVEPLLYGHSTGLSPVSVIVAAVFWTWIWGPIGLILSTPLTLCLVVMGRHVKSLEFFDVLLGDRPALSPAENFYQRILADNPDEAVDKAAAMLENRSLLDYYDGVVLEGLTLAAEDEARGLISRERSAQITKGVMAVLDDLEDHVDAPAKSGAGAAPIPPRGIAVCLAGRSQFDDAVSTMMAQLLIQRGVTTRRASRDEVSRDASAGRALDGAKVIVISYLKLTGTPAHVRHLVTRLRQRAPGASIVLGLWPSGESILTDQGMREMVGADRYVESLRRALEASLEALGEHGTDADSSVAASQMPQELRPALVGPSAGVVL